MMTDITKKYKNRARWCKIISVSLVLVPLLIYATMGFINGTIGQKTTLGLTLLVCLVFVLINSVFKYHIRSTIWIMLLGIQICLTNITSLLVIIAISTMMDEFIFKPLAKKYKQKYIINNEIDKRG
jgi:predicted branched-subunit amino acid permease